MGQWRRTAGEKSGKLHKGPVISKQRNWDYPLRTGELWEVCRQGNDSARLGFVLNDARDSSRRFLGYCRREMRR